MEAEFSLIDVFSDRPFGGNQLAVFPRAEGLTDEVMQQLAREFNFAESTFVLPSSDPACTHRVRIFTPRTELPFAGHPTVGTAAVLASRNPGSSQFLFEEGIGPVTVIADGPAWRLVLPSPEYGTSPQPPSAVAVAIGFHEAAGILARIDHYYTDQHGGGRGVAAQLIRQLADPRPKDSSVTGQLGAYRNLAPRWTDWDEVRSVCQQLAAEMLEAEV
jgi:hypothetical protein